MWGIGRLLLVGALAVVSFMVALATFRQVPARECQMPAVADRTYQVTLVEPPTVNGTRYELSVVHAGVPVDGATVCMRADMGGPGGMSGMGTSNLAHQVKAGLYQVDVMFPMGGYWQGRIVVHEPGKQAVAVPLVITVH